MSWLRRTQARLIRSQPATNKQINVCVYVRLVSFLHFQQHVRPFWFFLKWNWGPKQTLFFCLSWIEKCDSEGSSSLLPFSLYLWLVLESLHWLLLLFSSPSSCSSSSSSSTRGAWRLAWEPSPNKTFLITPALGALIVCCTGLREVLMQLNYEIHSKKKSRLRT